MILFDRLIENNLRENLAQETKILEIRQKNELNTVKQTMEKEKQELQKKLRYQYIKFRLKINNRYHYRADMLSDINLEQQTNTNIQIRLLQIKHESDEV